MPRRKAAAPPPPAPPPPRKRARKAAAPPPPPAPPPEDSAPPAPGLFDANELDPVAKLAFMVGPDASELNNVDPTELVQTTEAAWIRMQGWTPLEFLVHAYRNPHLRAADRITAARSVLDYAHKRLPGALGLHATPNQPPLMPAGGRMDLSKLSAAELDLFAKLLSKANSNPEQGDTDAS